MNRRPTPIAPDESAALLADPPRLHARWRALLAEHHHLHGPEAAALLGVPEAALLASATGRGNRPLAGPLADILAPVAQWGRVLLAARNGLGVHLNVMAEARLAAPPEAQGAELRLHGEQHALRLATAGIARIDLFEEHDAHGRTLSLNWFDAAGHAIGRLFLMSKDGRERALPHLAAFAQAAPEATWMPGTCAPPPLLLLDRAHAWRELDDTTPGTAAWATAAILCADHPGGLELGMAGPGVAAVYRGPLGKTSHTPPAAHATDLLCKLHARPGAASAVHAFGEHGLSLRSADGGELRLQPLGEGAAAWRARVHERAQGLQAAVPSTAIARDPA